MESRRHRRNHSQTDSNPLSSAIFVRGSQGLTVAPPGVLGTQSASGSTTNLSPTAGTNQLGLHNTPGYSQPQPQSLNPSPHYVQSASLSSLHGSAGMTPGLTPSASMSSISTAAGANVGGSQGLSQPAYPASQFFSASTLRNLGDRSYERRKLAATEIESLVEESSFSKKWDDVNEIITFLCVEYTSSKDAQYRKGGLIGLAGCAIGLGPENIGIFYKAICDAILRCLGDEDSKVRYYACEAMYNLAKVSRAKIIPSLHDIFENLCEISVDNDANVKNGAQLLDRLIKDIVTESESFDIRGFIPLIREKILNSNPLLRQFLVGWIIALNSVPDNDMLEFLPDLLEGLFLMLSDQNKEIKRQADIALSEFLSEIKKSQDVEYGKMIIVLINKCSSQDEFTKLTALVWCRNFINLGKNKLLFYFPQLIGAVLSPISNPVQEIRDAASNANIELMKLLFSTNEKYDFGPIIWVLLPQLKNDDISIRIAALNWFMMLHERSPFDLAANMDIFFKDLISGLGDIADEVVRFDLEVLCRISCREPQLSHFISAIIEFFRVNPDLLRSRGNIIIERIAISIDQETIFRLFSSKLENETDFEFAEIMSQTLHVIVLTSPELYDFRSKVKNFFTLQNRDLFTILYKSCCHSPVSLFSLCLLGQAYEHAYLLLSKFMEIDVTLNFLLELDKLVQLLESPVYSYIRLQLLEPMRYPSLYKCLYGVLMMIPQSKSFEILKMRLTCLTGIGATHVLPASAAKHRQAKQVEQFDWTALANHFTMIQSRHSLARKLDSDSLTSYLARPQQNDENELPIPKVSKGDEIIYNSTRIKFQGFMS